MQPEYDKVDPKRSNICGPPTQCAHDEGSALQSQSLFSNATYPQRSICPRHFVCDQLRDRDPK